MALLLFAAGGPVLPPARGDDYPEDLEKYFQQDGRWAVLLLAALYLVGSVANVVLFDTAPLVDINSQVCPPGSASTDSLAVPSRRCR